MDSKQKRHPKALPYLFLTELWERYGFYVVQGMLVLYMTKAYGLPDSESFTILGVFTSLAYISPMIGGYLADRLLGFKAAIAWGGMFLVLGYGLLALPVSNLLYLGLATIIVGAGLFKPNISSLLGALYKPEDPARDSGFTIFYIGINLGTLMAGVSSGIIKNYFGWHASFATASLGLIIGFITFYIGLKFEKMSYKSHHTSQMKFRWLNKPLLIFYCFVAIGLISYLLQSSFLSKWLLPSVGIVLLFFIFGLALKQKKNDRNRLLTLNVLIISSVFFWMIFFQLFLSANLFIDRLVDKQVFGLNIPTTFFYTLESVFVILLGPGLAWSWHALTINNINPTPFTKFILGIFCAGIAVLVLSISTYFVNSHHFISPLWIVLAYFFVTLGDLLLSPIGLAAVTLLAPHRLTGLMMGIWFVSLGFGGQFAGMLAKLASIPEKLVNQPMMQLPLYRAAFLDYALISFGIAIILMIIQRFLENALTEE